MRIVQATTDEFIEIGKQGENGAVQVQFPVVEEWTEQYGTGVFQLLILRPKDATYYAVPVTMNATAVLWTVSRTDVAIPGIGGCELRYVVGDAVAKSQTYTTLTRTSVGGSEAPYPTPWEDWVDQVLDAAADVETTGTEVEAAKTAAETAQGKAEDAQSAAETAQGKAEDAQSAAETAQGLAEAAQTAAETAQGLAEAAQTASETAWGKAEDAQAAAETAQGKAEDAQTAAETAQGLAEAAQTAAETAQGLAETAAQFAEATSPAIDRSAASEAGSSVDSPLQITNAANRKLKSAIIKIDPVQSGSGDPSSSNVRLISGITSCNLRWGKGNLYNGIRNNNTNLSDTGKMSSSTGYQVTMEIDVRGMSTIKIYYYNDTNGSRRHKVCFYNADHEFINGSLVSSTLGKESYGKVNANVPTSAVYMRVQTVMTSYLIIHGDSLTTPSIPFPEGITTIYGGEIDLIAGKLTITKDFISEYNGETLPGAWISSMDVYEEGGTPTTGAQVAYDLAEPVVYDIPTYDIPLYEGDNILFPFRGDVPNMLGLITEYVVDNLLSGFDIDSTLSEAGKAADAKATGDKIRGISAGTARYETELGNDVFETTLFVSGGIYNGSEVSNQKNVRSIYLLNSYSYLKPSFAGKVRFFFYNSVSAAGYSESSDLYQFNANEIMPIPANSAPYFRIMFVNATVTNFSQSDIDDINANTRLFNNAIGERTRNFADESISLLYNRILQSSAEDGKYTIIKGEYRKSNGDAESNPKFARLGLYGIVNPIRLEVDDSYVAFASFYTSNSSGSSSTFISNQKPRCIGGFIINPPAGAKGFDVSFFATDHHVLTDDDIAIIRNSFGLYGISESRRTIAPAAPVARSAFMEYMAEVCTKLGLSDSHFANASGLTRESYSTPRDELKIGIAVAGNPVALDIWSTKNRSFEIGGENARTISVTSGLYSGENDPSYKIIGGKGGSLTASGSDAYKRRARIALYDLNGSPIAITVMGKGDWIFDNITPCMHDLVDMMEDQLSGNTPTPTENITHLLTDGGGYAAIPVPICAGAYLNSYSPADLLLRENSLYSNESASQIPASTTKTLTMLCALSIIPDLSEIITISSGDITSGSGSTFYSGDTLTIGDALRIMMMESSNTMAEAIGRFCGIKLENTKFLRDN